MEHQHAEQLSGGKRKVLPKKSHEIAPDTVVKKRLLNVNEAAQYLGSIVNILHKKRSLREIPFVKIGRSL